MDSGGEKLRVAREGMPLGMDLGPSREGGGELLAKVRSARMSLSCRSVKFQNTTTP